MWEVCGICLKTQTRFNQPIGNWDVSSVSNMIAMFEAAASFNQDISGWCVTNIVSEPNNFSINSPLSEINKPDWGTCPTTSCFINDGNIQAAVDLWISDPTTAEATYGNISNWDTSCVTNMSGFCLRDYTTFNDDISQWDAE